MKASYYRAAARQTLSGNWKHAVIVTLVFFVLTEIIPLTWSSVSITGSFVGSLYKLLVVLPLSFAFIIVFFNFAKDNSDVNLTSNLFRHFTNHYGRAVLSFILLGLILLMISIIPIIIAIVIAVIPFVSDIATFESLKNINDFNDVDSSMLITLSKLILLLIPLLLVACIPMIIYWYRVCLFPILLVNNPNMGIIESFSRSAELMKGHKWEYFCLEISFIGWYIIGILSAGIGFLWIIPYNNTACSHFYLEMLKETSSESLSTESISQS